MSQIELYSKLKEDKYDTFKDAFKSCLLLTPKEIKNHKPDKFIEDMFNTLQDFNHEISYNTEINRCKSS